MIRTPSLKLSAVIGVSPRKLAAWAAALSFCLIAAAPPVAAQAALPSAGQSTLQEIRERGELRCGVSGGLPGFSAQDEQGAWRGLDVDFCRALAAAIFDDPSKVAFTPLPADSRFASLVSGAVDVLSRNTTWTLAREATMASSSLR